MYYALIGNTKKKSVWSVCSVVKFQERVEDPLDSSFITRLPRDSFMSEGMIILLSISPFYRKLYFSKECRMAWNL